MLTDKQKERLLALFQEKILPAIKPESKEGLLKLGEEARKFIESKKEQNDKMDSE